MICSLFLPYRWSAFWKTHIYVYAYIFPKVLVIINNTTWEIFKLCRHIPHTGRNILVWFCMVHFCLISFWNWLWFLDDYFKNKFCLSRLFSYSFEHLVLNIVFPHLCYFCPPNIWSLTQLTTFTISNINYDTTYEKEPKTVVMAIYNSVCSSYRCYWSPCCTEINYWKRWMYHEYCWTPANSDSGNLSN